MEKKTDGQADSRDYVRVFRGDGTRDECCVVCCRCALGCLLAETDTTIEKYTAVPAASDRSCARGGEAYRPSPNLSPRRHVALPHYLYQCGFPVPAPLGRVKINAERWPRGLAVLLKINLKVARLVARSPGRLADRVPF